AEALTALTLSSLSCLAFASIAARRPAMASAAPAKWVAFCSSPSLRGLCSIRIACSIDAFKRSISSSVRASRMSSSRLLPTKPAARRFAPGASLGQPGYPTFAREHAALHSCHLCCLRLLQSPAGSHLLPDQPQRNLDLPPGCLRFGGL